MGTDPGRTFSPDYAVPPGATLLETIEHLGLSQADLAERTGRPKKTINEIINGKAAITPETALQLERVLGVPAAVWNSLEQHYRAALARIEERARLSEQVGWLKNVPVKHLVERGWVAPHADKADLLKAVLGFFGVASPGAWEDVWGGVRKATAFRTSRAYESDFGAVAAWLRQGEIEGRRMECAPYDATRFKGALNHIRGLTGADPKVFCGAMQERCASAGVAVVFVEELPKLRVCGAARWLSPAKALIQLSLYYKRDDQFWFSFFHEAGHILLHGKREVFVDSSVASHDEEEEQANRFAADYLIPPHVYSAFVSAGDFSHDAVTAFARTLGIAPGIVVGRLQHDKHLQFSERNHLKRKFEWARAGKEYAA